MGLCFVQKVFLQQKNEKDSQLVSEAAENILYSNFPKRVQLSAG